MNVGPGEILVILIVALLVFGPKRLPEVGRQVGSALRELRKIQDTVRGELDTVLHPEHETNSGDAPSFEPDDHSIVDAGAVEPAPGDVGPGDFEPGDVTAAAIEQPNDHGFSGPSDSFI